MPVVVRQLSSLAARVLCVLIILLAGVWSMWFSTAVCAESAQQGITVAPARVMLDIKKGSASQVEAVSIKNSYSQSMSFDVEIWGMQQTADGSLSPSAEIGTPLAASLSVMPTSFSLEPNQSINLQIRVTDSSQLSPGGHYASLLIKQTNNDGRKLSLSPAVSVAVFIIKEEGAARNLTITSLQNNGSLLRPPRIVTATFANSGNVSVVPRAFVSVRSPSGTEVATGVLNQESLWVMPGSSTKLQTKVRSLALSWVPGRYRIEVAYRYDGSDDRHAFVAYRWVVPLPFVGMCILGIGIAAGIYGLSVFYLRRSRSRRRDQRRAVTPDITPKAMDVVMGGSGRVSLGRNKKPPSL